MSTKLADDEVAALDLYWRAANYLSVGQIYLMANPLLEEPLEREHVKPRLLGHWGTTPGLNFIYAHLNRVIKKRELATLFVIGPGHGGPALVANTWLEGSYSEIYPDVSRDAEGMRRLFKQFSFPGGIPSHCAPEIPGSIHEGGELGYSLAHAFGAAFDNPKLVVACVVGDGEAETGALATSWHSNKFLNPVNDGAVLDRTISELAALFPAVQTISVVPVGETQHAEERIARGAHADETTACTPAYAHSVIEQVAPYQARFREQHGVSLVHLADEYYLTAGVPMPRAAHVGDVERILVGFLNLGDHELQPFLHGFLVFTLGRRVAGAQQRDRRVGFAEVEGRHVRANRYPWSDLEELDGVLAREIGDRAHDAFTPQKVVRHRRDVAHVDAAQHQRASLVERREGQRHQRANRREDDRAIERMRRLLVRGARPPGA